MENIKGLLLGTEVPAKTKTYSPISHGSLISAIGEQIDKAGLTIKAEHYSHNRAGKQMFGNFVISAGDAEQDMNIGFRNSYDKSMQVGMVAGSRVIVCSNMMFAGDFKKMGMHYGNIAEEIDTMAREAVEMLELNFNKIKHDSQRLKEVQVDKRIIAEVLGDLFFNEQLLTTTQLSIIRDELKLKENFSDETMWDIYNHTTEALKKSPVVSIVDHHIMAHEYYMARC